jgi:hypothetical protein
MTPYQQDYEIRGAQDDLVRMGLPSLIYVTPCGAGNKLTIDIAKKYYAALRGSESGFNSLPIKDPYTLYVQIITPSVTLEKVNEWLNTAKNTKSCLILMFHQIDETKESYSIDPKTFTDIIQMIKKSNL